MKFLVDAQLPPRLARLLTDAGHDALHTSELPAGNRTTDTEVSARADADGRVVVTKDADFRDSHLLNGRPRRLLVVATGNITNNALIKLFTRNLDAVIASMAEAEYVELGPAALVIHRNRPDDTPG